MKTETPLRTATPAESFPPGMEVGARRWPDMGPFYGTPWKGVVLAINDLRAWIGTAAFGFGTPTQEAVDRHVAWCEERGLLQASVPVLWDFGDRKVVHWTLVRGEYGLRSYEEDVVAWREENALRENRSNRMLYPV